MKKRVRFSVQYPPQWTDDLKVQHVLPNEFVQAIGPFVLLDHITSCQPLDELQTRDHGACSLPRRGVVTLTYILRGEVEHFDSMGNHVTLYSDSAHWMNAGKGIIHAEIVTPEYPVNKPNVSVVRFWINLPSKYKCEDPEYISLLQSCISNQMLFSDAGWIRILIGKYENIVAKVTSYSNHFLYHIRVEGGKMFSIKTEIDLEYAAFLPTHKATINDMRFQTGELIAFASFGELIEINNYSETAIDIILFGGEPYNERIVADGTFVMNNPHEITQAYNDYYDGKYGEILFDKDAPDSKYPT